MPLTGKRVLVTRGEEQAEELASMIRGKGGIPVLFPTVRLVPADDPAPLDSALARLSSFDWILFASANAAKFFWARAAQKGVSVLPPGVRVASVGPGTSRELARLGFPADLTAERHTAEGLAEALGRQRIAGKRFLLPRAVEGREALPEEIARQGGTVEEIAVYRNGLPDRDDRAAREIVAAPPDVCTFASPSAFRNFFLLLGEGAAAQVLSRSRIAVIGEVTARAVAGKKFTVDIMPETYTLVGMVEAIASRLASCNPSKSQGGPQR